jgi:membrane protease YdiL (CAAX protease family)
MLNQQRTSLTGIDARQYLVPFLLYFGLAIAFSWMVWLLIPVLGVQNAIVADTLGYLGTFGPALAAMLVTASTSPEYPANPTRRWQITAVTGIVIWLVVLALRLAAGIALVPARVAGDGLVALLAGYVLAGGWSTNAGIRRLLSSVSRWRFDWRLWLVIAALFPVVFYGTRALIFAAQGAPLPPFTVRPSLASFVLSGVVLLFFGGSLGEEVGWRGFALPLLQQSFSPLNASLVLALGWSVWHAPLYVVGVYNSGLGGLILRLVWMIPVAIVFTWVANRTRGSLLAVIVLHTSFNLAPAAVSPIGLVGWVTLAAIAVFLIVRDRMWTSPPPGAVPDHPLTVESALPHRLHP